MANSVIITLGFSGTDFTRDLKFDNVPDAALADIVTNAKAVNASLAGGTDDGLADFFISDDYDATDSNNVIGKFNRIVAVSSDAISETVIV